MTEVNRRQAATGAAVALLAVSLVLLPGTGHGASSESCPNLGPKARDLTGARLEKRKPGCIHYTGSYTSTAKDVKRGASFKGELTIAQAGDTCVFKTNSIPNHDFNDGGEAFANPVQPVCEEYALPIQPKFKCKPESDGCEPTPVGLAYDNGILLNGVKMDVIAAACYGVGGEPRGQEKIGCFDMKWAWRYDPMFPDNGFGADKHNAHAQPDGAYHYHANPHALFEEPVCKPGSCEAPAPRRQSPLIGFAADGFPIFGPYIRDPASGRIRKVKSSYVRKPGWRQEAREQGAFPGGRYDGSFRDDYEFVKGSGDLDKCNGMTHEGVYGYYVTDTFPYLMACFWGFVDDTFKKEPLPSESPR
ncbi:MAG TPA: YHYH protein [Myxococcus sp.]|nr:YHYH protein [Myxococcus sp.]